MWKKTDEPNPTPQAPRTPAPQPKTTAPRSSVIGPSIRIKGDLTGKEDLVIQGQLEGAVSLESNNVTIGPDGRIRADIYGRSVHVEGEVDGNLHGEEEVVIRASGRVKGNIVSPRVVLENGSKFKGSIDMEPSAAKKSPKVADQAAAQNQTQKTAHKTGPKTPPVSAAAAQRKPSAAGASRP